MDTVTLEKYKKIWKPIYRIAFWAIWISVIALTIFFVYGTWYQEAVVAGMENVNVWDVAWNFFFDQLRELVSVLIVIGFSLFFLRKFKKIEEDQENEILISRIVYAIRGKQSIDQAGLFAVHNTFPLRKFTEKLKTASDIRIITTWMNEPMQDIRSLAKVAAKDSTKVRILMLDPDTEIAAQRNIDLGHTKGNYVERSIKNAIDRIQKLFDDNSLDSNINNFCVRKYKGLPSIQAYICDDYAYISFYWWQAQATQAPTFEFRQIDETDMGEMILNEFERIWGASVGNDVSFTETS